MNDEMPQLAAQLTELAENAGAGRMPDVERARREGRGRMRRRRLAALGGAAAVLVAVGLLGSGLRDRYDGAPGPAVSPTVGPTSLTANVRFGWLPDPANSGLEYLIEDGRATASVIVNHEPQPLYTVVLTPPGSKPGARFPRGDYELEDAPKVHGRPAYWLLDNSGGAPLSTRGSHLRWQVPGGRWAELTTTSPPRSAEAEQAMLRVAEGVTFGAVEVPLPVRFADTPGPVRPIGVSLSDLAVVGKSHNWRLGIAVEVEGQRMSLSADWRATAPTVTISKGQPSLDRIVPANGECLWKDSVELCLSSDAGVSRELTPDERALILKVLDGVTVNPDFK